MSPEENKAVVRRFWDEFIVGGNLDLAEELLAPDYVNLITEHLNGSDTAPPTAQSQPPPANDLEGLKVAVKEYLASVRDVRFDPIAMAAEGDHVFARVNMFATRVDGSPMNSRALAYYQVVDGKIVLNDLLSVAV